LGGIGRGLSNWPADKQEGKKQDDRPAFHEVPNRKRVGKRKIGSGMKIPFHEPRMQRAPLNIMKKPGPGPRFGYFSIWGGSERKRL
jgi:hypothetical protein